MFFSAPEGDRALLDEIIEGVGLRPVFVGEGEEGLVDALFQLWIALALKQGGGRRLAISPTRELTAHQPGGMAQVESVNDPVFRSRSGAISGAVVRCLGPLNDSPSTRPKVAQGEMRPNEVMAADHAPAVCTPPTVCVYPRASGAVVASIA